MFISIKPTPSFPRRIPAGAFARGMAGIRNRKLRMILLCSNISFGFSETDIMEK